ncbi:MAG: DNA polymerase III subunit gamma/tau [Bdellovibrionaceae bacterium]|nr:DNA polymerase III subunit gamma/tau [Pseudobdellovibrionaceae bacterium]MDW8189702.1 DNA polymerase III subunit gamma/tau [Pseudobdellovibrionaceae bacterium]
MSYEVFARKYRPQSFHELIGQDAIRQTLQQSIQHQRLHHALLFTGPRGTGKTSTARILAKTLRCPNVVEGRPCQKCPDCTAISAGHHLDVVEIDGASHNGVEAIRELRESVHYTPSSGKYKIFIIDEVHMLSTSAFNALLKTLEEPPPHVIFILATTEAHKIPATILSRCQKYQFKKIPTRLVHQQLQHICKEERIEADDESLWLIAKSAQGSLRDAESTLDQLATFLNCRLNHQQVISVLGLDHELLVWKAYWAILEHSSEKALSLIQELHNTHVEPKLFLEGLLRLLRNTLLIQAVPHHEHLAEALDLMESEYQLLQKGGEMCSSEELHILFDMAHKGLQDVLHSTDPQVVLEVVLLRLIQSHRLIRIEKYKEKTNTTSMPSHTTPSSKPKKEEQSITSSTSVSVDAESWLRFVESIRLQDPLFAAKLEPLLIQQVEECVLHIALPKNYLFLKPQFQDPKTIDLLKYWIKKMWQKDFHIVFREDLTQGASALEASKKRIAEQTQSQLARVAQNEKIQKAQKILGGHIRILNSQQNQGGSS